MECLGTYEIALGNSIVCKFTYKVALGSSIVRKFTYKVARPGASGSVPGGSGKVAGGDVLSPKTSVLDERSCKNALGPKRI